MSTDGEIFTQALGLPVTQRFELAQRLWESLGRSATAGESEAEILETARRRDQELTESPESGRSHDEVMKAAREAIQ